MDLEAKYKVKTNENWVMMMKAVTVIKNEDIREFIRRYLEEETPDYFAKIPASASGKYHPSYTLGFGGLIRHTIAAAICGWEVCSIEYLHASPTDRDLIYSALLVHDTFKQGETESGTTIRTHPGVAAKHIVDFAKKINFDEKAANVIARLVLAHMGQWGNNKPGNRMQYLVHQADYFASRKFFHVDIGEWLNVNAK